MPTSSGVFPESLKTARVIRILKSDDRKDRKNYRLISFLPFFSKDFKRVMHERLFKYLTKIKIISSHQNGFIKTRSTTDAIFDLCDRCYNSFESKQLIVTVLLDLMKAFDTIEQVTLCEKIEYYAFTGFISEWFKAYLTNGT